MASRTMRGSFFIQTPKATKQRQIDNINILCLNIQCLSNKSAVFLNNIDLLCLTELWLNDKQMDLFNIRDFWLISSNCRSEHIHGEVAIFCQNHLDCAELNDIAVQYAELASNVI